MIRVALFPALFIFGFFLAPVLGDDNPTGITPLSVSDLARLLNLNILKFHVTGSDNAHVTYWVDSFQPDGLKRKYDEVVLGLGKGESEILILLPNSESGEFSVVTGVNATKGRSRLTVDTETQGSEAWRYSDTKTLQGGVEAIIAIRVLGGDSDAEIENIEEYLDRILAGDFVRVDVFNLRIRQQ